MAHRLWRPAKAGRGHSGLLSTTLAVPHGSGSQSASGRTKCVPGRCIVATFRRRAALVLAPRPFRPFSAFPTLRLLLVPGFIRPGPSHQTPAVFLGVPVLFGRRGGKSAGPHHRHHGHHQAHYGHHGHHGPHGRSQGTASHGALVPRWYLTREVVL